MKQDAQLTAVEWLVDKILTEADKYNEDGDVIGIELWNAYKGCVDLSKFVEQAKEMEKEQKISLLEWIRNNAVEVQGGWQYDNWTYTDKEILEVYYKQSKQQEQ